MKIEFGTSSLKTYILSPNFEAREDEMFKDVTPAPERTPFDLSYLAAILEHFIDNGFEALTLREFFLLDPSERKCKLLLRLDVDAMPERLPPILELFDNLKLKSTVFWQVHGQYNPFFHDNYFLLKNHISNGNEVGLHSNFYEFAMYFNEEPAVVLERERAFIEAALGNRIYGHSCHRDVNYLHNSLPILNRLNLVNLGFEYSAYDSIFNDSETLYVNEGLNPHLNWRNLSPEEAAESGKNVCLLLHPHWWHSRFHAGI